MSAPDLRLSTAPIVRSVVIGAQSGIGRAVSARLSRRRGELILACGDLDRLEESAETLRPLAKSPIQTHQAQLEDRDSLRRLFDRTGQIDHLVIAASAPAPGRPLAELDLEEVRLAFERKLWGSIQAVQLVLPYLSSHGSVTLTSGIVARKATPGALARTVINAALEASVKVMARELAPMRVNAVSPGLTDGDGYSGVEPFALMSMLARAGEQLPVGRVGRADEIASAYLFAIDNAFVTGTVIDVDGGALIA
ncbi:SDR family oxidoreductase [Lysobacter sp. CA199]|uniref:SDR family oxidoreductase n=1 Tax=Lysobacter sp. CA199 TaxID=3455608 RepID=UPI003F8D8096